MTYEEAKEKAQLEANEDGYNRLVFLKEDEYIIQTQDWGIDDPVGSEIVVAQEKCDNCGRIDDVELMDYEEDGEGWDYTPEGKFCRLCMSNMIGDI